MIFASLHGVLSWLFRRKPTPIDPPKTAETILNEDAYRAYLLSMIPEPWEKGFLIAVNQCNCSCYINADGSADVIGTDDPDLIYSMELYRSIGAHVRYYRDMQALADKRHVDVSPILARIMRLYDAPGTYKS